MKNEFLRFLRSDIQERFLIEYQDKRFSEKFGKRFLFIQMEITNGGIDMAVMRIHKTGNFTIISNTHLRDKNLSLKAKGLLTLMLSLPDNWDYSVNGLTCICKEGKVAVQNTLDELEENRYLVRNKERTKNGRFTCVYEIYEVPQEENQSDSENSEPDLSIPYDEADEEEVPAEEESNSAETAGNSLKSGTEEPSPEHRDGFCATDNVPRHTLYRQKTNTKQQKPKTDTKHREIYIAILAHLNQKAGAIRGAEKNRYFCRQTIQGLQISCRKDRKIHSDFLLNQTCTVRH